MLFIVALLNVMATESLGWRTPLEKLTGQTPDISPFLQFQFYDPVYYASDSRLSNNSKPSFPSETAEGKGCFVGISDNVGDAMTFKILTDDTQRIIHRSNVRSALDPTQLNLRLEKDQTTPLEGESLDDTHDTNDKPIKNVIKFPNRRPRTLTKLKGTTDIVEEAEKFIGRTYLQPDTEEGERHRVRIQRKIVTEQPGEEPDVSFLVSVPNPKVPDFILAYDDAVRIFEDQDRKEDPEQVFWKYKDILGHKGPLLPTRILRDGSAYKLLVLWEDGSKTYEPLKQMIDDDIATVAAYGQANGLLESEGWDRCKGLLRRSANVFRRYANQAKMKSFRNAPIYQYGYRVPRTPEEAIEIDRMNGNKRWQEAIRLEMVQLNEYNTFKSVGKGSKAPEGYKKIKVHFVFAVKQDGRHKARLVAGGHLTDV